MQLTSTHNPFLQEVRRAVRSGQLTSDGLIVIEGPHLIAELSNSAWRLERILLSTAVRGRYTELLKNAAVEVVEVSSGIFDSVAGTQTTQGLLALAKPRQWRWQDLTRETPLVVVLDGIQDPGNAGNIARSAEAFGASGVVFSEGCPRLSNGKLLRSAAGSLFRLPYQEAVARDTIISTLRHAGIRSYVLTAGGGTPLSKVDLRSGCALVIGNEGSGISTEFLTVSQAVSVPTTAVESLNAAVAGSIVLFEAARQRASL